MAVGPLRGEGRGDDLTGAVFGRLTAIGPDPRRVGSWRVRCLCGQVETASAASLRRGDRTGCRRCGPLVGEWYGTPTWERWQGYRRRRQLVPQWEASFRRFLDCVGAAPFPGAVLMRPDPNEPLGPQNWRWATPDERTELRRLRFEVEGREVGMAELIALCGAPESTVRRFVLSHPGTDGDAVVLHFAERAAKRAAEEKLRRIMAGRSGRGG